MFAFDSQSRRTLTSSVLLAATLAAAPAFGTDVSFKLEPGVSIPLTAPQSEVYGIGGGQSVKALFGLSEYLDVGPLVSVLLLPAVAPYGESGIAWGFGAGLRLKRPHDRESYRGTSPWFDADFMYIGTGPLSRPGFDAAVGFSVPIGESRTFWVGPFVRYMHVMTFERPGYDSSDAKILTFGVSFEVGTGIERKPEPVLAALPPEIRVVTNDVIRTVTKEVLSCPDRDGDGLPDKEDHCADVKGPMDNWGCPDVDLDGVPDSIDHCPEVKGPMDNFGCPNYPKLAVKRDKLELKEKLYFAWDDAKLEDASFPTLDDVVQALKDNKNFRVQVEGHTDSSGPDDHNQSLSEKRAEAVLDYLAAHGIAKERLVSKGFSSSVPIDTNTTVDGRENNRRVEFVVHFIILPEGSSK